MIFEHVAFSSPDNPIYIIALTVGFEANLNNNTRRKKLKYYPLLIDLAKNYNKIGFINLCISCSGVFGSSSNSFLQMCNKLGIDNHQFNLIISKLSNIIISMTYYILFMRNKAWCDPELLN